MPVDKKSVFGDPTLRVEQRRDAKAQEGLSLIFFGGGVHLAHPLPTDGEVILGRGDNADVRIDDASVSRRHARLRLGETLTIEDLDSSNGTRVREAKLAPATPVAVSIGEVFEVGSLLAVVQKRSTPAARPRRQVTHSYFEVRLEDECGRAQRTGSPFALLRARVDANATVDGLQEQVIDVLRAGDLVASYGPNDYEILLPDTAAQEVRAICDALAAGVRRLGADLKLGVARFPEDGRTPEALIASAGHQVVGTTTKVGDRVVVVEDEVMRRLHALAARVAQSDISVLVLGETGVGKEVVSETIHRHSPRAAQPFLRLNCAALTETLLESELFGHEKGSFTGATAMKQGLLESAHRGTVFLDEVGELSLSTQVKLLRVLEEHVVLRVGGLKPVPVDVRFIAATNRNLEEEVVKGGFRQDLYYRLNGINILIPPLRERPRELERLANHFCGEAAERCGLSSAPALTPAALQALKAYSWPGNIRELRNVIERAVLLAGDAAITVEHLPLEKMQTTLLARRPPAPVPPVTTNPSVSRLPDAATLVNDGSLKSSVEELERQRILDALDKCAGNQSRAAKMLGISRTTLLARLDAYGVARPRKPGKD